MFYRTVTGHSRFRESTLVIMLSLLIAASSLMRSVWAAPGGSRYGSPGEISYRTTNPAPPGQTVKLIFIHHSTGEGWLADDHGRLGIALRDNNTFVSDTNYDWGPDDADVGSETIGDHTDIGHWYNWFAGPHRETYLSALYTESHRSWDFYSRLATDPGGENEVILFKSCFPNSQLEGNPGDPPTTGDNPLRGQDASSNHMTVANAKGIYNDILAYFATRRDKLFVVITAPPLVENSTDAAGAANARAFNRWLVYEWLAGYPYHNVAVFDFYNVLTSNGGDVNSNDLGWETGNHHRWWDGAIQHLKTADNNFSAYGSDLEDSHPTAAGGLKATGEFVSLLNVFYHRWQSDQVTATPPTPTATATLTVTPVRTSTPIGVGTSPAEHAVYLPLIMKGYASVSPTATPTATPTPTASPTPFGTPATLCADPQPPLVTDLQVRQAPSLPEPQARVLFRDPVFGTCLVRVTDRTADLSPDDPSEGLKNEYSRVQSFNADESRILVRSIEANWYLYDAATLQPLGQLPIGGSDPRWDASDPFLLYYADEARLMAYNVQTGAQSQVHDFAADFPGQPLAAVWTRYEGSPSRDGRYWGLMAQDQDWQVTAFLVYDRQTDEVTARRDLPDRPEIDSVTISPLGNTFLAYYDNYCPPGQLGSDANPCGLMAYDRDLGNGRGLLRVVGHSDLALDAQGREVLIYQDIDTDHISLLDLATGAVTALWPIDFSHTAIGLHFSGRAFERPGWALVSTSNGGYPTAYTWMDDQVFAVELKPNGRVVRLAHTHSLYDETQEQDYWAEPHASVNRDFTRVVFTSNWGRSGTGQVEMLLGELPSDWPARLP